jgi:hypothetical protein
MSRRMWPYEADRQHTVRSTIAQRCAWGRGASIKGVKLPVFLAMAGDFYAEHLKRQLAEDDV